MKTASAQEVLSKIEVLHRKHLSLRGILQYVKKDKVGKSILEWGSKTDSGWFDIEYKFKNPITETARTELNSLSEFMNQNFIVRLHSLLEFEGIKDDKTSIDKTLDGYEMIEVIHFLRKQFAHKDGVYNPQNEDARKLRERLLRNFDIKEEDTLPHQFPLDKNKVILPIVNGTKKYVQAFIDKRDSK